MPTSKLQAFRYRVFDGGIPQSDVTFYRPDQADADSCARAWIRKFHPDHTIKRIRGASK